MGNWAIYGPSFVILMRFGDIFPRNFDPLHGRYCTIDKLLDTEYGAEKRPFRLWHRCSAELV